MNLLKKRYSLVVVISPFYAFTMIILLIGSIGLLSMMLILRETGRYL